MGKFSLKSLFVVEEPTTSASTESKGAKEEPSASAARRSSESPSSDSVSAPVTAPTPATPVAGDVDQGVVDSLISALEAANQSGYDYFEFSKSVEQQKSFLPDEKIRFQSSLAAASVMNVTPAGLVESANHYLAVLASKEKEFEQAQGQFKSKEIEQKQSSIVAMEKMIAEKAELITKLTAEIGKLQKDRDTMTGEIAANTAKIESIRSRFQASLSLVAGKIRADIDKIKTYLMA